MNMRNIIYPPGHGCNVLALEIYIYNVYKDIVIVESIIYSIKHHVRSYFQKRVPTKGLVNNSMTFVK